MTEKIIGIITNGESDFLEDNKKIKYQFPGYEAG